MSLLHQAKLTLGPALRNTHSPFRNLSMLACTGLLAAYGSIAVGAIPIAVATLPQGEDHNVEVHDLHDGDQDENVEVVMIQDGDSDRRVLINKVKEALNVKLHKLHGDQDGNVEVIAIQEGDSDHRILLNKVKEARNVRLHKLHGDQDGNIEVVVLKDGEHDVDVDVDLHGHVAGFLHGKAAGNVNHKELARKLREIADQLDGGNESAHANHELHQEIEIHHGGDHEIHIQKKGNVEKPKHRVIEFNTKAGKHIELKKSGEPRQMVIELSADANRILHAADDHKKMIIELKADADGNVHAADGGLKELIFIGKDHGVKKNIIVEEIHLDSEHDAQADELHFGHAKTSDESDDQSIEALRTELNQLKKELDQLQSIRDESGGKRLRWVEEKRESGRRSSESKGAVRVIERLEKEHASGDEGEEHKLIWVEESNSDKPGNTFTFKKAKDSDAKTKSSVFEFEFNTDKQKSGETKKKRKKD